MIDNFFVIFVQTSVHISHKLNVFNVENCDRALRQLAADHLTAHGLIIGPSSLLLHVNVNVPCDVEALDLGGIKHKKSLLTESADKCASWPHLNTEH